MREKIGLSLSGGGYRAAAFHLGTLKKLHEFNLLDKIDVISAVSGGSIVGAAWCLHNGEYDLFHAEFIEKLKTKNVLRYILASWVFARAALFFSSIFGTIVYLTFTNWSPMTFPLLLIFVCTVYKYQFKIFPISKVIEKAYSEYFFKDKKLKDLKPRPLLVIGSSNLHSGRPFTFSKNSMSDSSYAYSAEINSPIVFKPDNFPIARAVMASSCVPFAFTPVLIDKEYFLNETDYKKVKPVLVDGGVYDNQGMHKLTQNKSRYECDIIITSDAGGNFYGEGSYTNVLSLLVRTVDLFMYRIKALQMSASIYLNANIKQKQIAYYSLGWRIDKIIEGFVNNMCDEKVLKEVIQAHCFLQEWIEKPEDYIDEITVHLQQRLNFEYIKQKDLSETQWKVAKETSTNLTSLSPLRIKYLIQQAENLAELQVKLYCPSLIDCSPRN